MTGRDDRHGDRQVHQDQIDDGNFYDFLKEAHEPSPAGSG
jgi:hypothetical protein